MENNQLEFNNKIRMWRAEKKLSQEDLADMVGVSRQTISSIENLQFCPSAKRFFNLHSIR